MNQSNKRLSTTTPIYKLLLIGDSGVGKSSLLLRYTENSFEVVPSTLGFDFKVKPLQMEYVPVKLQIWDTGGQERYRTITKAYYRGASGIAILFAVDDRKSFENVTNWWMSVQKNSVESVGIMLVAAKCDCENEKRVVTTKEAQEVAANLGIPYFETSARSGKGVPEAFFSLASLVHEKLANSATSNNNSISNSNGNLTSTSENSSNIILNKNNQPNSNDNSDSGGDSSCC